MRWYQTKYSLTSGIALIEDGIERSGYVAHGEFGFDKIGRDIFPTLGEAQSDQRERARKAIAAAEKKIAKFKKILEQA